MDRKQLIKKYLKFFESKKHKIIPNASLIPKDDPTVLFTTAGMHPLVPYLLGQKHPLGKKLTSVQKCIRTTDIEEVGDTSHHTFIEMLGNWSLGDYWKSEAIEMSLEFLTKILGIPKEKIAITCFAGDKNASRDTESADIWKSLGVKKIKFLGGKNNWWGPAGKTGPCGPCTEMFVNKFEIWNDVFMEYKKEIRLILVDGMHCLYDKNFNINKELLKIINDFNTHTILTVAGFREKGLKLIRESDPTKDTNWQAFSLEKEKIDKTNPQYFEVLLKKFNLVPEEVIYFDYDKKNVESAKSVGILSKHYTDNKSIKKFIEDNLYVFLPLKQKNIDTGMGVERTLAVLNGLDDDYMTKTFLPIIKKIEHLSDKKYKEETKAMRIIADHIKAAIFIIADGITPSNTEQGYVLRRLIRRAVWHGKNIGIKDFSKIAEPIFDIYDDYSELKQNKKKILEELEKEKERFNKTLQKGLNIFNKLIKNKKNFSGKEAFLLSQSYGFPLELIEEEAKNRKLNIDKKGFQKELTKHQKLSRTASAGKFKSGLADQSEKTTKLHTATHLLNEALRKILDKNIKQKGSNITSERLRFDFDFPRKLTEQEIKKVENLVNKKISQGLKVTSEEMPLKKVMASGIQSEFNAKYPDIVSIYSIGNFSKEICTGPHVKNTKEIGKFKILKEESSAAGIRRIKAVVK